MRTGKNSVFGHFSRSESYSRWEDEKTFFVYFFGCVSCCSSGSSCGNKSYCSIICFHNQVSCFNDINTMVVQIKYAISSTYLNFPFFITPLNATTKNGWPRMNTAQEMKFSIEDFFSKCDQIPRKLRIWPHLLKKSLMENLISCAVEIAIS